MTDDHGEFPLLQPPQPDEDSPSTLQRLPSAYHPHRTFLLPSGASRTYQHQFADMYFLRLSLLKPSVEALAHTAWSELVIAGERARRAERVLDVRQGELCWVAGTVYMEMPLKPSVLDDIAKEHWIAAPPAREKFLSKETETLGRVMVEDESGRLKLAQGGLERLGVVVVTGCIVAVLGTENRDGEFEVLEVRVPDVPRQPDRWEGEDARRAMRGGKVKELNQTKKVGKVAVVSGLEISGSEGDALMLDLLSEFLLGEGPEPERAAGISRLIIAGNSLADAAPIPSREQLNAKKAGGSGAGAKKYGYDATSYNPAPTQHLDDFIANLLPSMPVTIMPGASDPANVALPQQPLHSAFFLRSRNYAGPVAESNGDDAEEAQPNWFDSVTNPWEGDIDGHRWLGNAGQPIDDIFRYLDLPTANMSSSPDDPQDRDRSGELEALGEDRVRIMEHVLRWRLVAPTAPDTLWSYPFQEDDPMVVRDCPHVFFVGNQPAFAAGWCEGPAGQRCRLVSVPAFRRTGCLVLVDGETLEVETVEFGIYEGER